MNLYEELVNGVGYAVRPIDDIKLFKSLRDSFVGRVSLPTGSKKNINSARRALVNMSLAEINRLRINLLSLTNISEVMIECCSSLVEALCGKDLFIQRRANIMFNVPGKEDLRVWSHYEVASGISPFTYALWAPLHDLADDGGVFFLDQKASINLMKREQTAGLVNGPIVLNMIVTQKPIRLKFGQMVVFNPFILHGNVSFNSEFSRIGCSVRFQSSNKPLLQKNSDYLKYYRLSR